MTRSDPTREALQAVYDLGDELDSNHTRWAAGQIAERLGVTIRVHNDFSDPPRNRNEETIAELQARIDELAALPATPSLDALVAEVRSMLDTHACFQTDPPLIGVIELRRRLATVTKEDTDA